MGFENSLPPKKPHQQNDNSWPQKKQPRHVLVLSVFTFFVSLAYKLNNSGPGTIFLLLAISPNILHQGYKHRLPFEVGQKSSNDL